MVQNIALVAGGYSGEYVISLQSAAMIARHLDPEKYRVYTIVITRESWTYTGQDGKTQLVDKNDFSLSLASGRVRFEAVFIAIHGSPGEDGRLQGYLDLIGLPYTSCGTITSALTFNKSFCNKTVKALGLVDIAPSEHLFCDQPYELGQIIAKTGLPCFVKPNEGGSSIGMSKVAKEEDLQPAILKAFGEDSQVLVEGFVQGREFTCGLYRYAGKLRVLPVTEIVPANSFFDYEAKYTPGKSREITPAPIDSPTTLKITTASGELYTRLNCRGIVRIDYIVQQGTGHLFFLEANTMPGQTENSLVPQQVLASGMSLRQFYGQLIEECLPNQR